MTWMKWMKWDEMDEMDEMDEHMDYELCYKWVTNWFINQWTNG